STRVQRAALDAFGNIELSRLSAARQAVSLLDAELGAVGGDAGARAREMDLLRYQLDELDAAALSSPDEDVALDRQESELADATEHRVAASDAAARLGTDGGAADQIGQVLADLDGRSPFAEHLARIQGALAELVDVASEIRNLGESIDEDPERLAALRDRRQRLADLRRKYGTAPMGDGSVGTGTLAD